MGPPGVPHPPHPRPLVPGPWAERAPVSPGNRADTPGPGGPGGRERDGAATPRPSEVGDKWGSASRGEPGARPAAKEKEKEPAPGGGDS